jgi:tRNA A-37 threonylcarbamoyl transferase component Bud32
LVGDILTCPDVSHSRGHAQKVSKIRHSQGMGWIDRWLNRFVDRAANKAQDAAQHDDPETNDLSDEPAADSARGSVAWSTETSTDPLDQSIAAARDKLTLDEAGRRYAEGAEFLAELSGLDAGGRSRAADALLADALLVSPSKALRRELAERLLHRGERDEARVLLVQLADEEEHAAFALTSLGELAELAGDTDEALRAYERVLALDITLPTAKARARRLRAGREGYRGRALKQRAQLTRFLGARAAGSRYAVVEEIGRGGAATVFRARDRVVEREVALKIFHPRGRTQERRARLVQEARVAGAYDHPHIVPILDIDEGRDLLVMGLCEGGSLRQRLAQGRLSSSSMADIGAVLLRTLADVHDARGVHLDVKPSNLLFHAGRMMLCDFGTAGLVEMGAAAGTRAYMAPEQRATGEAGAPADIYAAGLVLYECIAGRLPETQRRADEGVALEMLPPGPRRRALERLLAALTADDPAQRPADPRAAADDLLEAAALPADAGEGERLLERLRGLAADEGPEAEARLEGNEIVALLTPPAA